MADNHPKAPPVKDGKPDPDALGFTPRQPMVKWFTPSELTRAGAESVISTLFGAYADNRELQAVRGEAGTFDYSVEPPDFRTDRDKAIERAPVEEMWIDYVADLGDGWDSTFAIASLLAAPALDVKDPATGEVTRTERGRVLVLGGDQVYPTAKREEYQNRFAGPYRAALPYVKEPEKPPHLFALPGNHDWYDGLTSFTRLFGQRRWIGGWKTQQQRSYFAIELPGNWWIWGVDIQLASDIDQPQWNYFRDLGRTLGKEHPEGVNIILCLAEPVWTSAGEDERMAAYDSLSWFEAHTMTRYNHRHVVGLAGDLHAYARWEHTDGRQRFISGGGGAYLYPTHRFPETLRLPTEPGPKPNRETETFELGRPPGPDGAPGEAFYPSQKTSKRLALKALRFPVVNKKFSLFFGFYYLFLAWLVQSASKALTTADGSSFLERLSTLGSIGSWENVKGAVVDLLGILAHAPLAFSTAAVLFVGLAAFADGTNWKWKAALGAAHNTLHLLAFILLSWFFAWFNLVAVNGWLTTSITTKQGSAKSLWGIEWGVDHFMQSALFAVEILVIGGFVAGIIWGFYLYFSNVFGRHTNEVFSCQAIPDYKHFLRLHIDAEGTLTIYSIAIDDVPSEWDYQPGADGTPWYLPAGKPLAERVHLVEPPIRVRAAAPAPPASAPATG